MSQHAQHTEAALAAGSQQYSQAEVARLKIELLVSGLRMTDRAQAGVSKHGKPALRVRSGACGGLDVILPYDVTVNCPIHEEFAQRSPFLLDCDGEAFFIVRSQAQGTDARVPVKLIHAPAYYHAPSRTGRPLSRLGQLCADRLGIGITNNCYYWRTPERRCKFCSIGLNLRNEQRDKWVDDIVEVAEVAFSDPVAPAHHVLIGGGTPDGPDSGALRVAEAARAIKARWQVPIYAMIVPPRVNSYIDLLKESGVDELGMNLELFDPYYAETTIPGKFREVGYERYATALQHAVRVFGPINTRSIMVVGIEPVEATLAGVEWLAALGVMPILSPFRPMAGTEMEHHPRLDADALWEVTVAATELAGKHGMPLGPTCIPCQENTLNLPGHPTYRYY